MFILQGRTPGPEQVLKLALTVLSGGHRGLPHYCHGVRVSGKGCREQTLEPPDPQRSTEAPAKQTLQELQAPHGKWGGAAEGPPGRISADVSSTRPES